MGFEYNEFKIIEKSLNKDEFRLSESLMSIGNEYMGMRGNFEEKYTGDSLQGTYIGGVWFPDKTRVGWWKNGYPNYFGKMINSPNFIGLRVKIDGIEIDLNKEEIESFYRELDMREGILHRNFTIKRNNNRFEIKVSRFVSIAQKEICAINYEVHSVDTDCIVEFVPYIDANVKNEDSNYNEKFWDIKSKNVDEKSGYIQSKTVQNDFGVEQFSICNYMNINFEGEKLMPIEDESYIACNLKKSIKKGETARVEKIIAVTTSRDYKEEELVEKAKTLSEKASYKGYESLAKEHSIKWFERWDIADVVIKNNKKLQQGIRYNIFQLFSTYYGEDMRLNIGPKGFTGEKYGGATYWDTEAYMVPMYLSVAPQEVSRNLLMYRYNQLKEAYHNAQMQGLKGALYPMVTFTGVECHNEWEITFEEIHRNGAIAYAIYNYANYTGDYEYVYSYGIDVLVGISRFWADRVHYNKRKKCYMMHGVTGPNEYENNVNNNWYTNTVAAWTIDFTIEMIEKIKRQGLDKKLLELDIDKNEIDKWKDITDNMYYPYDEELDVFVQHDTFLDKELMSVSKLDESERPLNKHWSWDKILRSCFIKQADVLQGIYFFNDKYTLEQKKKNYEFYEPMTVHESSLSACIHSILACEIGLDKKAVDMYERTSRLDLDNYNHDTDDGLHITSMSGSWLSIVQGFAGMRTFNEELSFSPLVPDGWEGYSFNINYRDRLINLETTAEEVIIKLRTGNPIEIKIYDKCFKLDKELKIKLK
ncbi:glycoside hydrolase family 65 protein [Peptostreptococcus faecalis]|uniref:glycoside hydrolase family 65 protein n=1 Tax=Peptostreptococcus faecalis TaxID=2045015 RepID=UPI000C7E8055|nr:glycoside hydrolase family 65 protein [Peptostreptococcus faecalis]